MLQIRLLGQFDIRLDGKRIVISSRSGQSLLAYLAMTAGTPHRREKLAGTIWPDSSDETARRNLRQELWRIRKAIPHEGLGETNDYLLSDEFTITFNPEADTWLDVAMLERPAADLQSMTSSLSLYQGELLPGFYDDWIVLERERIQALFEARMDQLVGRLVDEERWAAVQEQCERWLAFGNAPEPAYRALMLSYNARGDMARVSATYKRCVDDLREQFGVEPSTETHVLYNGLLRGSRGTRRAIPAQPSATVTFLFTDIQGSTRLLEKLGEQYATSLAEHHQILRDAIRRWNGREIDTQGDAFFVTFTRALDAVQCAVEAQRALASHTWPLNEPVRVRMGLHTGEPLIASTGYVGMDVHRAARIGDAGHGGQVLVSQSTRELVVHDLPDGVKIRDLGEHRLKDMNFPTPIYQLVIDGLPSEFPPIKTRYAGGEAPTPGEPPFKGLQYFDEIDSDLFFGREVLTAKLVSRLCDAQFLSVIVGASGSGKSSLVRAGLIPALKKGSPLIDGTEPPAASSDWEMHIITPTAHPLEAVSTELTHQSASVTTTANLIDDLGKDPRSLSLFLARQVPKRHTLLLIDQFEELFTLCRDEFEREAFIDNLLHATLNSRDSITTIVTLRADFYAHLAQYPELRDAVAEQQIYIGPMTADELRRAIEEPAKRGHWEFEPGLVDLILRDVGDEPGALPLLSHALLETWKRRAGHTLTLKGYADAGGVHGAIAHTAESIYHTLTSEEQAIARDIFLRLTELGEGTEDTRRRASFEELMSHTENTEEVRNVLNILAEARLITLGEDTAEVAHEALIREWPTLRDWLSQDREGLRLHRHLTEAAREWKLLERDPGALYRGAHLAQAREWAALHPKVLNLEERTFLTASIEQEQHEQREREEQQQRELEAARALAETQTHAAKQLRKRAFYLVDVVVIALLAALTAGLFANRDSTLARQNAAIAQTAQADSTRSNAQRLGAEANSLMQTIADPQLIALLSLRSLNTQYTAEGDAALTAAASHPLPQRIFTGDNGLTLENFSPDGKYLVVASYYGNVELFDAQTGQKLRKFTTDEKSTDIRAIFSPDGEAIYASSNDGTVWKWDRKTGKLQLHLHFDTGLTDVKISPDGKRLLLGGLDGTARLLDIQAGVTLCKFSGHTAALEEVAFSPDGRYVATTSDDTTARLWKADGCEPVRTFSGHTKGLMSVDFSPDGKYLATGSGDDTGRLWDVDTGQEMRRFEHGYGVNAIRFSPDGRYLLTGSEDKTSKLWNVQTGQPIQTIIGPTAVIYSVAFSSDGRYFLTGGGDGAVWLWDMQKVFGEHPRFAGHTDSLFGIAISPDGRLLATGGANQGGVLQSTRLWDVKTGQELHTFALDEVNSVAFSPDGRYLVVGDIGNVNNSAWLLDIQTGQTIRRFNAGAPVAGVAFSPDGKYTLTAGWDGYAKRWEAHTGELLTTYEGCHDHMYSTAYSADGQLVLTGCYDGVMRLYEAQSGKELRQFSAGKDSIVGVAFSPDGRLALSGGDDNTAHLWDLQTGKEILRLTGHTASLYAVVFSPDGKLALTTGDDYTARLWELQTGQELRRFTGHTGAVEWAVFSPNGKTFFTASDDGTAHMWDVDYHDTMKYLCSVLQRDFTDAERAQYNITDTAPTCPKQ
jgi:WD40 repeat protein/class 3 adenylate cyclase